MYMPCTLVQYRTVMPVKLPILHFLKCMDSFLPPILSRSALYQRCSIAMFFLLLQRSILVPLSHAFTCRHCCYAFIVFNKFCLDEHNMPSDALFLIHAEDPSSFSRHTCMSLCMVTITYTYTHSHVHFVHSCTTCTGICVSGLGGGGGGGASWSDLAGPTKMSVLRRGLIQSIIGVKRTNESSNIRSKNLKTNERTRKIDNRTQQVSIKIACD